ncbi:hypothetical protein [Actinoplanes sp. N902-109]|uniref:hypothetical protein n=1 Tax=Actinoplanes sp. (strain N902-109) TaxID=649831 RepID=UPI00032966A1|nr:hypothetical protein [Actinoplanes sp. N902-109]AGL17023.1 hypothetical protein L083_3513 [Actinoplanes sp. N902-109]
MKAAWFGLVAACLALVVVGVVVHVGGAAGNSGPGSTPKAPIGAVAQMDCAGCA